MRKGSNAHEIPPPLELECLKALWRIGEGTVKDVRGVVTENRNLAYTTVMTVLDRLEKRGSVQRKKVGRSFLYIPAVKRQELRRMAVDVLVDNFFDGSKEELMHFLASEQDASREPEPERPFQPVESEPVDTDLL